MKEVLTGRHSGWRWYPWPTKVVRVVDWNIERGLQLPAIIEFLERHEADVLTLQEVDLNARRTGRRNIAEEIARRLKLDYAFGHEYQELAEGSRGSPAYTGQATLSRWPIRNSRVIRFREQSAFWEPRWYKPNLAIFQERIGNRIALLTEIEMGGQLVVVFNLHLESRGTFRMRMAQLNETLTLAASYPESSCVVVAGDMNLEVSGDMASAEIRKAGFHEATGLPHAFTTIRKGWNPGRAIDGILLRDGFLSSEGLIHNRIRASDHFPISCAVNLTRTK